MVQVAKCNTAYKIDVIEKMRRLVVTMIMAEKETAAGSVVKVFTK